MLQGINRLGRSWVGRAIVAVMFGFLIISFAIWGIGDIFRGNVRTQVATVGGVDVTAEAYRNAYQVELQALIRRLRQTITPDQARALGLEQRVLARLVSEAAMDVEAHRLGLGVSDELVVRTIQADPAFAGPTGRFDRSRFNDLLRQSGLTEGQFVNEQRAVLVRQQLAEALTGGVGAPVALQEAVHRFRTERRAAEFVRLGPNVAGELPAPTDADLQAFYEERKSSFRAPEYRALTLLLVDPARLAKPGEVSDADARRYYDGVKDSRFGTPERRTLQQIVFSSKEDAQAAAEKVKAGTPFETVARERGITAEALEFGTFSKAQLVDKATAEAAFALAEGAVSAPIESRFGAVLIRVTKIEPGSVKPFEEVKGEVKGELARERARAEIQEVHDSIEDQRAGAKPLADIARERGLTLAQVAAVDSSGHDKAGAVVDPVPDLQAVLAPAFRSDVGADNEPVRTSDGGYIWFEVTGIEPARDRPLAEIRDRVVAEWQKESVARRLAAKARELVTRLDGGTALATVATEIGATLATASDLARGAAKDGLPANVVTRIFATPVGKAGSAEADDGTRVLFKVTGATMPTFVTTTQESAGIEGQLRNLLAEDVLATYVADVEKRVGVQLYPANIRRAIGGEG